MTDQEDRVYSILMKISEPDIEGSLEETLQKLNREFKNISFDIDIKEKKLVPFELVLDITIKIASGIAVGLVIKLLEKLWEEFAQEKTVPETWGMDDIQSRAERYLEAIGVEQYEIVKRKDKGPYVIFVFQDEKGDKHRLLVTSFDLKIIDYRREE